MEDALFEYISEYISLTPAEKQALIELDMFKSYKKGSILLREGERTQDSYFVMKGCLRVYYEIDGEEKTTGFYTEQEGVSPPCILTGEPSAYFIACVEDVIVMVANQHMEAEIFEKFPKFETMCRLVGDEQMAKQNMTLDEFKTSSPEQRYLKLLETRPDLVQRVPQYQLASFLGIKPQSLSRMRARILEKTK